MASTLTVKLLRGDSSSPWGFRLQGGKDFGVPLTVQRVNPGSLADQAGLLPNDGILKIQGKATENLRHSEAQEIIVRAGNNLELTVQRGGIRIWKPAVTPVGDIPTSPLPEPVMLTKTSLAHHQPEPLRIGSGHNVSPKPFGVPGTVKALVHNPYNSPVNLYSMQNIAETLSAQTEVLATGAKGINFMKEDKPINKESEVYRMVHAEDEKGPSSDDDTGMNHVSPGQRSIHRENGTFQPPTLRHVEAPSKSYTPAKAPEEGKRDPNACVECGKTIFGVFVKVKDKPLHPECFKCSTCGTSLRNVGYFNVNDKLYCDIHAKQAAKMISSMPPVYEPAAFTQVDNVLSPSSPRPFSPVKPGSPIFKKPVSPTPRHPVTAPTYDAHQQTKGSSKFVWPPPKTPPTSVQSPPFKPNSPAPLSTPAYRPPQEAQHISTPTSKIPPPTAPKPYQSTTLSSWSSPGSPGSRPAPRRGRGQLKPQVGPGVRIPICSVCGSPIRGPFVVALGKTWCPEHFLCANNRCQRPLQDIGFVEENSRLYCENCWEAYYAPICSKCGARIKGDCLNALEKTWHPQCFVCAYCHRPFGNSSFYMEDGQPYCEKDWNELFTTKCVACNFPIEAGDRWVEALNNNYHTQCFNCTICKRNLEGQSFYAKGGRPFCKAHAR